MIRYQCNYCNVAFDQPTVVKYREHIGENLTRMYEEERCPICGCESFRDADECQQCGAVTEAGDILCRKCRRDLKKRIVDFFDYLTAEEEEQFDEWMDGDTIMNRRKWK